MLRLLSTLGLDPESLTRREHTQCLEETSSSPGSSSQLPRQDPRLAPPEVNAPYGSFAGASNCDIRGTFNDVAGDQFNLNIRMQENDSLLDKLPIARRTGYQAVDHEGCLEGTRKEELQRIEEWEADHSDKRVYWLNGPAGCGKSSIARTFCERSSEKGRLGATFFCSRDFEDRRNIRLIFPTLAYELAHRYTEFKTALIPIIKSNPNIGHTLPAIQFENLLVEPLKSTKLHTTIIIDALDECKEGGSASVILSVLGEHIDQIPFVKFFITGRPETPIRSGFWRPLLRPHTEVFLLHEVDRASIDHDIRLYVEASLKEIAERSDVDLTVSWPPDEEIVGVVEKSSGLFILSSVIVRYVASEYHDPRERLKKIISRPDSTIHEGKSGIDGMYQQVFAEGFEKVEIDDNRLFERLRLVVGSIVLAFNPVSCATLAVILDMSQGSVRNAIRFLHSVLTVPDSDLDPMRICHKSFADFITDADRCTDNRFYIDTSVHHLKLVMMCLKLMNEMLKRNICGLSPYAMNKDIRDLGELRENYIGGGLEYACRSWAKHLRAVSNHGDHVGDVIKLLEYFFKNKLLSWLEVSSLVGDLGSAVYSLRDVRGWLIDVGCSDASLLALVKDSERFVLRFFDAIEVSSPHIYASALLLCPTSCHVRAHYQDQLQTKVKVLNAVDNSWDACIRSIQIRDIMLSVAFSHKDDLLAVAEHNYVEIFETVTGQRRAIFTLDDSSAYASLAFSPDDTFLVSGHSDRTVYVWDLQTGGLVCTLKGHTRGVSSVVFSPCGNMIASCSADGTIRIWSVSTHECLCILRGHSSRVQNVSWLGTGSAIVSCSAFDTETVKIWDISEARCLKTFEFAEIITALSDGHLPDSSLFAVGCQENAWESYGTSNGTIKVVDAHTHDVIQTISTNSRVDSIRFLNQDKVMYTAGSMFFIHDLTNNSNLLTFEYEGGGSPSAISSDGFCITTSGGPYDSFMRVWQTGNTSQNHDVARHGGPVHCVAFSGDGHLIASASLDAVKLWEATSGRCLDTFSRDGVGPVTYLRFSPDSTLLAHGRRSGIRIWMIESHTLVSTMAVTGDPTSMQFSPDGSQLASFTCRDRYDPAESMHLELWEVETGDCLASTQVNDRFDTVAFGVGGDSVIFSSLETQAQKRWMISPNTRDLPSSNSNNGNHSPLPMSFFPLHDTQQPTSLDVPSHQVYYEGNEEWILDKQKRRVCWVMPDMRGYRYERYGEMVVIGSRNGRVTIVDVSDVH